MPLGFFREKQAITGKEQAFVDLTSPFITLLIAYFLPQGKARALLLQLGRIGSERAFDGIEDEADFVGCAQFTMTDQPNGNGDRV